MMMEDGCDQAEIYNGKTGKKSRIAILNRLMIDDICTIIGRRPQKTGCEPGRAYLICNCAMQLCPQR